MLTDVVGRQSRMQKSLFLAAASRLRQLSSRAWKGWPDEAYQQDSYQLRLAAVQEHVAQSIELAPHGPVRVISVCAGDGRDIIGSLESHRRRRDVVAWLVELDSQSVAAGIRNARSAGLANAVNFINGDATLYLTYKDIAPSDVVIVCGVWGHVPPQERSLLVRGIASLCKSGGRVIWTRGVSRSMARFREIQSHFVGPLWETVKVSFTLDHKWAIATNRYCGSPSDLPQSGRMFHFRRCAG